MLIASRDRRRGHFGALSVPIYNVHVLSELSYWNEDLNPASCVCPEIIGYEVIFEAWGVAVAGSRCGTRSPVRTARKVPCATKRSVVAVRGQEHLHALLGVSTQLSPAGDRVVAEQHRSI